MLSIFIHSLPAFFILLCFALISGVIIWRVVMLPGIVRLHNEEKDDLISRVSRIFGTGLLVLALASVIELLLRAADMSGSGFFSASAVSATLLKTHFGKIWTIRFIATAAALLLWLFFGRSMASIRAAWLMAGVVLIAAFTQSATGHAADTGDLRVVEIFDWLHLLAASCWGGGILIFSLAVWPAINTEPADQQKIIAVQKRFSLVSYGALMALLVATAFYNAWNTADNMEMIFHTPYGKTIILKSAAYFLLLFFAASVEWHNNIPFNKWLERLSRVAKIQVVLVCSLLLMAAMLRQEIPAKHQIHIQMAEAAEKDRRVADQMIVTIKTLPEMPKAGVDTELNLSFADPSGRPISGLSKTHERLVHVIIVGQDLDSFAHIHPDDFGPVNNGMVRNSRFTLRYRFPKAGKYLVAVDTAVGRETVSKVLPINVTGTPVQGLPQKDLSRTKSFAGIETNLTVSAKQIEPEEEVLLSYMFRKNSTPVTNLQPYLGAPMHLAIVSADGSSFVHTHGELPGAKHTHHEHAGHSMTDMEPPPQYFGPVINAEVTFPQEGLYKVFGEVKHEGKVIHTEFMLEVMKPEKQHMHSE